MLTAPSLAESAALPRAYVINLANAGDRRAVVTEAEGTKQAAITVAEGQKQSSILSAEGQRQSAILRSEGYAQALRQVSEAAAGLDPNTMTLQYLDTLNKLGDSPATKFVVPAELTGLLNGIAHPLRQAITTNGTVPDHD